MNPLPPPDQTLPASKWSFLILAATGILGLLVRYVPWPLWLYLAAIACASVAFVVLDRTSLKNWANLLILLLPFSTAGLLWSDIPDPFPLIWNSAGELTGYGDKVFGLLFFPVLNVGFAAYATAVPWILGRITRKFAHVHDKLVGYSQSVRMGLTVIFTVFSLDLLGAASGRLSHRLMTDLPAWLAILGFWFAYMFVTFRPLLFVRRTV